MYHKNTAVLQVSSITKIVCDSENVLLFPEHVFTKLNKYMQIFMHINVNNWRLYKKAATLMITTFML